MGIVWGSTVGFVAANLLLWVASYLPSLIAEKYALSETIQSIAKYILVFGLLLGPIAASVGGLFIGALFGGGIVYFRRKAAK